MQQERADHDIILKANIVAGAFSEYHPYDTTKAYTVQNTSPFKNGAQWEKFQQQKENFLFVRHPFVRLYSLLKSDIMDGFKKSKDNMLNYFQGESR